MMSVQCSVTQNCSAGDRLEADCRWQSCSVATGRWTRHEARSQVSKGHVQCWAAITEDSLPAASSEDIKGSGTGCQADWEICRCALVSHYD